MADEHSSSGTVPTDHRATYDRFITMTKWGVVAVAIALILMAIFLA